MTRFNRCWVALGTDIDKAVPGHRKNERDSGQYCQARREVVLERIDPENNQGDSHHDITYVCEPHAKAWMAQDKGNTWRRSEYVIKEIGLDLE